MLEKKFGTMTCLSALLDASLACEVYGACPRAQQTNADSQTTQLLQSRLESDACVVSLMAAGLAQRHAASARHQERMQKGLFGEGTEKHSSAFHLRDDDFRSPLVRLIAICFSVPLTKPMYSSCGCLPWQSRFFPCHPFICL